MSWAVYMLPSVTLSLLHRAALGGMLKYVPTPKHAVANTGTVRHFDEVPDAGNFGTAAGCGLDAVRS